MPDFTPDVELKTLAMSKSYDEWMDAAKAAAKSDRIESLDVVTACVAMARIHTALFATWRAS